MAAWRSNVTQAWTSRLARNNFTGIYFSKLSEFARPNFVRPNKVGSMRRILRKSLIPFLLLFLLLVNAGLFEVRSGASVPVQAGTLIGGLSRSSSSLSVSQL